MRLVVVSDTHNNFAALNRIVLRHKEDADLFLHLGDGAGDVEDIRDLYPGIALLHVRGNCDFYGDAPVENILSAGEVKVLYTHGHSYAVKSGPGALLSAARTAGVQVVLFGHTHHACTLYEDGIHLMNPGSPTHPSGGQPPSYGIVDITKAGIVCHIVPLREAY